MQWCCVLSALQFLIRWDKIWVFISDVSYPGAPVWPPWRWSHRCGPERGARVVRQRRSGLLCPSTTGCLGAAVASLRWCSPGMLRRSCGLGTLRGTFQNTRLNAICFVWKFGLSHDSLGIEKWLSGICLASMRAMPLHEYPLWRYGCLWHSSGSYFSRFRWRRCRASSHSSTGCGDCDATEVCLCLRWRVVIELLLWPNMAPGDWTRFLAQKFSWRLSEGGGWQRRWTVCFVARWHMPCSSRAL